MTSFKQFIFISVSDIVLNESNQSEVCSSSTLTNVSPKKNKTKNHKKYVSDGNVDLLVIIIHTNKLCFFKEGDHCWRAKALTSESNKKINYDKERKSTEGKDYFKVVF